MQFFVKTTVISVWIGGIFFGNFFKIIFVATFSPGGTVGIQKGFVQ